MEKSDIPKKEKLVGDKELEEISINLSKVKHPIIEKNYYFYQGFWVPEVLLKGVISFQKHYVAQDDDIVLASCPKSGTTWLKSLAFTIVNRTRFTLSNSPLLSSNPHELVPFNLGYDTCDLNLVLKHENMKPRLYSTHIPYSSLPPSIKNSNCKIVYICRNPLDLFVSLWNFSPQISGSNIEPKNLEEYFDIFCQGISGFGPFWDHVLGFWKASLDLPNKILFLKYEDLQKDNVLFIKKIADFLGFPFSAEEEQQGLIEDISKFCSIGNMRSLEINKIGKRTYHGMLYSSFFRKGELGDWRNYLTPEMAERGKKIIEEKFRESNLTFDFEFSGMEV